MSYKPKLTIFGAGGGGSASKPHTPYEAPNTLQSVVKGRILDLIAFGPIHGLVDGLKSVYLDGTAVQNLDDTFNFEGIKLETRNGLPDQDYIPGFTDVENTTEINTDVLFDNPPVRSVSNNDADAVLVTIQLAALVQQMDNGDSVNASVTVLIDYRTGGGAWNNAIADTITGKTTSPFPKTYRIPLEGQGPFDIRVRRGSKESQVATYQDKMSWTLLTEIIDKRFSYPHMALVGITVNSKLFGTTMPSRSYDMKLSIISVPSNYDPETRAYTGIWNGTFKQAWTDNPAWAFYDLATHPIIGAEIKNVDKWLLYRIAQYCDELVPDGYGGMEPRFTINTLFAAEEEAMVALSTLASVFRGMAYWGSDTVIPVGDMPTTPRKIVSPANVVEGEISYVGTSMKERHSVCTVMWNDPNDADNAVPEIYQDADSIVAFGWRETRVTAVGCNSRGQALRMAKWILYSERMETQTISYTATLDHADLRPGDIIEVADPDHQGARMAGRIVQGGLTSLVLDQVPGPEVLAITSNWRLNILLNDGTVARADVSSFSGNTVNLLGGLPSIPENGLMWALSATELNLPQFRVVSNKEDTSSGNYSITATEYDPNKYSFVELGLKLPDLPTSLLPTGAVAPPMDLSFEAYKYYAGNSEHQGLIISWTPPKDVRVDTYVLDVMDPTGGGAFRTVYTGAGTSYDLKDAIGGRWSVRVRSISTDGVPSMWVSRDIQVAMLLLPTPPDSVKVITGTFEITLIPQSAYPNSVYQFWRSEVALEQGQIESNATQLATGTYLVDAGLRSARTYFYYIRGVNQYGLSAWYAVQGTTEANFDDIMDHITEEVRNGELGQEINTKIETVVSESITTIVDPQIQAVKDQVAQQGTDINARIDATEAELAGQIAGAKADLEGQLGVVEGALTQQIATAKNDLTTSLNNVKTDLQTQIDAIEVVASAGVYSPDSTYAKGDSVRLGQKLYQALKPVPAGVSPPNAEYWLDVGQVVADSNGLATRVQLVETKVTAQDGVIAAQSGRIDSLTSSLNEKADASALESLTTRVTSTEDELSTQAQSILSLTATLHTQELDQLYAGDETDAQIADALQIASGAATATESLTATVTQQGGTISAQGQRITELTSELSNISGDVVGQSEAIESLKSITTAQGNTINSQGESITTLTSNLQVTNTNVTAAQQAAQDASDKAGSKGEVIYSSSAPAVAKRLPQNLWIDTTGGANTPKRWDGNAWTAVTDKVATDAAAAAANALTQLTTKADASALTALTSRVTSAEGLITSQGSSITQLNNSLTVTNTNVTAAQNAANAANTLAGGKGKVIVQAAAPAVADQLPQNLWIDMTGGANTPKRWSGSAWLPVTDKVATDAAAAAANALSQVALKADASALTALTNVVTQQGNDISAASTNITKLTADLHFQELDQLYAGDETDAQIADALQIASGAATATQSLTATVTKQGDTITAQGQSITNLTSELSNITGEVTSYGEAIESLKTITTAQGNTLTSQGESLTALSNSLTVTNTNVTAAQEAANAANTLAGGKGKVIVQNGAPAVADQLAQNLWIDTTGGANTPKRWSGSQWLAVTDKVATDAAAAAANALSIANTKADASAVASLTTRVTSVEGTVASQGTSITQLNNSLSTTNTNVTAAQNAANAANTLAGGKGEVIYGTAEPAVAKRLAQNLWIDTNANANTPKRWNGNAWVAVTDKVATDAAAAAANALSVANSKADASALTSLTTRVTTAEGKLSTQGESITQLNNSLTITNSNVTTAQNAANAANTLAGGKGKVIIQAAAPGVADRLPQNLWIDMTGGANTPKRWSGSAWLAVTDKAATDAAAAAASALAQVALKADASALTALTNVVTQQGTDIAAQSQSITQLNTSLHFQELDQLYAGDETDSQIAEALQIASGAASANQSLTATVTQQGDKITAQGQSITQLSSSLTGVQALVSSQGSAIENLNTVTTAQGDTLSTHTSSLTALNSSLTTTNNNVTAAQEAANAANTLAGGKGKVIVQNGAPAVADRLAQNLWIDTTGGANTPKRWSGSQWLAVTDKVATDAAAAAANALSQVALKADASAVNSLSTTVTQQGNTITAQGNSITALNTSVGQNTAAVQTLSDTTSTLTGSVANLKTVVEATAAGQREDGGAGDLAGAIESWKAAARFSTKTRAMADDTAAAISKTDTLEASLDATRAAVQVVSSAQAAADGKASAMYAVKLQVNQYGQYEVAGFGLGIENGPAGLQSTFLINADRFAFTTGADSTLHTPFAIDAGKVYIRDAVIKDGSITNAKIGGSIQSDAQTSAGLPLWKLDKTGSFQLNGEGAGLRREMRATYDRYYDTASGILVIEIGELT